MILKINKTLMTYECYLRVYINVISRLPHLYPVKSIKPLEVSQIFLADPV